MAHVSRPRARSHCTRNGARAPQCPRRALCISALCAAWLAACLALRATLCCAPCAAAWAPRMSPPGAAASRRQAMRPLCVSSWVLRSERRTALQQAPAPAPPAASHGPAPRAPTAAPQAARPAAAAPARARRATRQPRGRAGTQSPDAGRARAEPPHSHGSCQTNGSPGARISARVAS